MEQIEATIDWLSDGPHPNLDLEYVLGQILMGRLQLTKEVLAIAHTSYNRSLISPQDICGAVIANPDNSKVSLAGENSIATKALFALVHDRGHFQKIALSCASRDWIRPILLQTYQIGHEQQSLIMLCHKRPDSGRGRWARSEDIPALKAYMTAHEAEQGIQHIHFSWDKLIQQRRLAVLEHEGQIVSLIRWNATHRHGMVAGTSTLAPFCRRGFAKQLLQFLLADLFQSYSAVKLWVNESNLGAIALYKSVGFQTIGSFYSEISAISTPQSLHVP